MNIKQFKEKLKHRYYAFGIALDSEMIKITNQIRGIGVTRNYIRVESGQLLRSVKTVRYKRGTKKVYGLYIDTSVAAYGNIQHEKALRHPIPPTENIVTRTGGGSYSKGYRIMLKQGKMSAPYPLKFLDKAFEDLGGVNYVKQTVYDLFRKIFKSRSM